ncbi:MAG: KUP/HAK/KT family potassium transporter [Bacteroidia bacterium]|nr:KUP/HAK/KT family potassium transporter [Bacteroidia bacterium]
MQSHSAHHKLSLAGLLVTLGIIFGDIGTSPLYVMKAAIGQEAINEEIIYGVISCILWTLTLQTTFKYVVLTLQADNRGEGGIFSLYALIRRSRKWLLYPAMIGGAALLADGFITPPISISAAVEGLRYYNPEINTVSIVISILVVIFAIQQFGTHWVGVAFGPIMFIWFSMLAVLGISQLLYHPEVLRAINPMYAYQLLAIHPEGYWVLGAVFLCTTGAEALYSDLGHCGKANIRVSWIFVKCCLLLNYFGQAAWAIDHSGMVLQKQDNPFYLIMPQAFLPYGIVVATMASIIASQALISGSFTLISEAMRLNLWPKIRVFFPSDMRGQIFVPSINLILFVGTILVTLYFKESAEMEAAYGLAITLTMLMTTILYSAYLHFKRVHILVIGLYLIVFLSIELSFFFANLVKFFHGGYVTLILAGILGMVMYVWYRGRQIRNRYVDFVNLNDYMPLIDELSHDDGVPKFATHAVYLTSANNAMQVENKIIYSILQQRPKRADIYWFVHVDVLEAPHTMEYSVKFLHAKNIVRIDFRLGFKVEQKINFYFRKVIEEMVERNEINVYSRYQSLSKNKVIGDFRFIVIDKLLSYDNRINVVDKFITYFFNILKKLSTSDEKSFGLDSSNVLLEKFPLLINPRQVKINRVPYRSVNDDE